jgi:hypothetical protein
MLSSDERSPWKRSLDPILKIARKHRQVYVTQWYPSKFGRQDVPAVEEDPHRHEVIIRQIIPTRTGLNNIKSTATVWLWTRNSSEIETPPSVIRRPWTDDSPSSEYEKAKASVKVTSSLSSGDRGGVLWTEKNSMQEVNAGWS